MQQIVTALMPVFIALIGYLATRAEAMLRQRTKVELEAYHREALHRALETGAKLVVARMGGDTKAEAEYHSSLLREVVEYAERSVPDAIAYLQAQFDVLIDLAETKIADQHSNT